MVVSKKTQANVAKNCQYENPPFILVDFYKSISKYQYIYSIDNDYYSIIFEKNIYIINFVKFYNKKY